MKKKDTVLREFARGLDDEALKWSYSRVSQRLGGDVGEFMEHVQSFAEMDRILSGAKDADGFYNLVDEIEEYLERETKKRSFASTEVAAV